MTTRCSRCRGPNEREGQRYCHSCHARYNSVWRKARTIEFHELRRRLDAATAQVPRRTRLKAVA